ncbi:hypothetical protein Cni_G01454 [Canna indica]|uniref:RING-type domain-containing protein n=1 Tax=Canna indica TaxID=4628 RepID=A0AAQ3JMN4_9LILI|nr:hypothetical protein Cni_G01454 [Canna indica]
MDGRKHAPVLEVTDTPDILATRRSSNDDSRTSVIYIDLDEETILGSSEAQNVQLRKVEVELGSSFVVNLLEMKNDVYVEIPSPNAQNLEFLQIYYIPQRPKNLRLIRENLLTETNKISYMILPCRDCLKVWKEVTSVTTTSDGTLGSAKVGQMAQRGHKGKDIADSFCQSANAYKAEESQLLDQSHNQVALGGCVNLHDNPVIILSPHRSNSSMGYSTPESESEGARHHRHQKHKAKRKYNSVCLQFGEWPSLSLEGPEISHVQSSTESLNPKSARCHNAVYSGESLGKILDVDEINSPTNFQEEICSGYNDSIEKLAQLESDEILARQLQEQFNHELQGPEGTNERDESMAHQFVINGPSLSFQSFSEQLRNCTRVSSSSRMAQSRRNFNSPEMDLEMSMLAELRTNFNSGEMDLETRLNIAEALEAAFQNDQEIEILDDALLVEHGIIEDDYEMLVTLDDFSYQQSGASASQINSLPQSVIQSTSNVEACVICLEPPTVGDVIHHLPCLHKFHKECIDTWLRRRTSCPVCKSGVF